MTSIDPSQFYTGLVAKVYRHLRRETFDPAPYERFVRRCGQPALELGCGDGDPILDLVAAGLDVEGLDSSADMLDRCRVAAAARGLAIVLHHASFETMDLGRRYRAVYLAGATFNLLPDDAAAACALARIVAHLEPGGAALIPLFIPEPTRPEMLGVAREHTADDGSTMRCTFVSEQRDDIARNQSAALRYELLADGVLVEAVDRPWQLHWHTQDGFRELAEAAGLHVAAVFADDGSRATPDATGFSFLLTRPADLATAATPPP